MFAGYTSVSEGWRDKDQHRGATKGAFGILMLVLGFVIIAASWVFS
jgi:hypothetical protein